MVSDNIFSCFPFLKKASEYGQEIPQSHCADQPTAYVKHVNPDAGQFVAPWAKFEQKRKISTR